jgi:hypothetical protein
VQQRALSQLPQLKAERYAAVADYAERHGMQVLPTGGPTSVEAEYGATIVASARHAPRNLIGQTTPKQLLALIQRATVLVSGFGSAHMATTVGTRDRALRDDEPMARRSVSEPGGRRQHPQAVAQSSASAWKRCRGARACATKTRCRSSR